MCSKPAAIGWHLGETVQWSIRPKRCGSGERGDVLAEWFAAGKAGPARRVAVDFGDDLLQVHFGKIVEFGVAEMAAQIASGEADKGGGLTDAQSLPLDGVEDFVYLQPAAIVAPNRLIGGPFFSGVGGCRLGHEKGS